ncbi:hypothetical protein MBLNU230_g6660t1 [Neophaeotheca triangularis]
MVPNWVSLTTAIVGLLSTTTMAASPPSGCDCGYQDPNTEQVYTDALIVYFNETDTIDPEIFKLQDFASSKQQGYNSVYKLGAKPKNAQITNDTYMRPRTQSLQLQADPPADDHTVYGGSLKSQRQDLQYGTFRAGLRGASQWTGGTALSFMLRYNASEALNMDVMNMAENGSDARVSYTVNGEWPDVDKTVTNYTELQAAGIDPWTEYLDLRMDWNETDFAAWVGGELERHVSKGDRTVPMAGLPMFLRTWSTGDSYYMAGPPGVNGSRGHVLYVRSFFNSSAMTSGEHDEFDKRCGGADLCSVEDVSLRGATAYSAKATERWELDLHKGEIVHNAGIVAACCSSFGIFALINVFFRRTPWGALGDLFKKPGKGRRSKSRTPDHDNDTASDVGISAGNKGGFNKSVTSINMGKAGNSESTTSLPMKKAGYSESVDSMAWGGGQTSGTQTPRSGMQTPLPAYEAGPPAFTSRNASMASLPHMASNQSLRNPFSDPDAITPMNEKDITDRDSRQSIETPKMHDQPGLGKRPLSKVEEIQTAAEPMSAAPLTTTEKGKDVAVSTAAMEDKPAASAIKPNSAAPAKKRIDYLAGIVAIACLGVTLHHFCQTFWPWVTQGYGPGQHYEAERWFQIFLGSYVLTQFWIGLFFLTATRFLCANFLKNGNLEDIAKKELRRAPRLFVPILIVSLLEYFLLEMGVTGSLEYLASVSWATWPYVEPQPNFGVWMNNMVELAYLMPNAIPEVVTHYCIGVLWTVPVQLQFTYVILTGSVLIRGIKDWRKRAAFFALAIVTGWYARSWSSIHWCGLVLADLEITYKWRTYLGKHPAVFYTVCSFAFIGAAGAPILTIFNQTWSFNTAENSIHPDFDTGKPIAELGAVYPGYNEPTLAIMIFSIGLQMLVELTSSLQWFLSLKPILWLHPHIMTIYLTHGFVMWSWGAWVCVQLAETGNVPYWANLIITLVTTYAWIFILARVLTPLMEFPTQAFMRNLDRWTRDEPLPKRMTIAPFGKELVVKRMGGPEDEKEKGVA